MASVNDYGEIAGETLADPALGGANGWAAAVARVVNNSDLTVDERISALQNSLGPMIAAAVPTGTIVAYAGSAAPSGWHLCDGSVHGNGVLAAVIGSPNTPDLRDRFIVGAGQSYAKGAMGGVAAVTLTEAQSGLRAHGHGASSAHETEEHTHSGGTGYMNQNNVHNHGTDVQGEHNHGGYLSDYIRMGDDPAGNAYGFLSQTTKLITAPSAGAHGHNIDARDLNHLHSFTTQGRSAAHTHAISVAGVAGAAATASHENRPPYYALTYIVKG